MKASIEDIKWYDNFYENQSDSVSLPPWYVFIYEELKEKLKLNSKILEVGCGKGLLLKSLIQNKLAIEENIFGIDQSNIVIDYARNILPKSKIEKGDIYDIEYKDNFFDIIIMAEVIEHLTCPDIALCEINRVLKRGGKLFISFPNYYNLPWLIIRIFAEKLDKPNWIVLQPVDKIYYIHDIIKFCQKNGLVYYKCIGTNYFPPILYKIESKIITKCLNIFRLNWFSFHPILIFGKK